MAASAEDIERVYRERFAGFRNALATVTGSHESARDCVQEAFARALAERGRFRAGSLEAWIWRIALDRARDARRRRRADDLGATLPPAQLVDQRDAHPALVAAIRTLPPRRRLVVFLHYYAD